MWRNIWQDFSLAERKWRKVKGQKRIREQDKQGANSGILA